METRAYAESYLSDAMNNLGDMFDYAIHACKYAADDFYNMFTASGIARQFGNGNPKFVTGMSGIELAHHVIYNITGLWVDYPSSTSANRTPEYWAGWSLAQYQWYRSLRFSDMPKYGLSLSTIISKYHVLHEADITKFFSVADDIINRNIALRNSNLQIARKARGYTQAELSDASGVSLRMVQLYEQRKKDINKAQVISVKRLANALACDIEDILEPQMS